MPEFKSPQILTLAVELSGGTLAFRIRRFVDASNPKASNPQEWLQSIRPFLTFDCQILGAGTQPAASLSSDAPILFELTLGPAESRSMGPRLFAFKKNDQTVFIHTGGRRIVADVSFEIWIPTNFETATISGPKRDEAAAILIETWIGFHFERKGGVRLHALAVRSNDQQCVLIVARPGFGKSTLALHDLDLVIADETAYIKDGSLLPQSLGLRLKEPPSRPHFKLPTRHGTRFVVAAPGSKDRSRTLSIQSLHLGCHRVRAQWWARIELGLLILCGIGLQQNPEYTLGRLTVLNWLQVAHSRWQFFRAIEGTHLLVGAALDRTAASQLVATLRN